jgi:hypothetical protein
MNRIGFVLAEFERRRGERLRAAAWRALVEGDPTAWTIVAVVAGLIVIVTAAKIVSKRLSGE